MIKMNNTAEIARKMEFAELFQVEKIDGTKTINRWGFFAKEDDGNYVVYKPEQPLIAIGNLLPVEDGPGAIIAMTKKEIHEFLGGIDIKPIALGDVNICTACGWYYDTETAGCEDPTISAQLDL
jgi:hypothetical protein